MLVPRLLLGSLLLLVVVCVPKPPLDAVSAAEAQELNDPYESTNRFFYTVNDGLDTYVLRPVAVAYRAAVPGAVRRPIRNVLTNLAAPTAFANEVIQTHPRKAGDMAMRFLINSTVGVGGLFDVATEAGYPDHDVDFGLTLALWGVGEGPFLFLPVLGPSNPRDVTGFGAQFGLDPLTYASFGGSATLGVSRAAVSAVDTRERLLDPIDSIKRGALDPYATFRSLYRQNRADEVARVQADRPATVPAWFSR